MKHLYFVRHGLSVMNVQGVWSGTTDTPLTPEGEAQARQAGQQLKAAGIDCIVASPVKRTLDTATIIASEIAFDPAKILPDERFTERDFGPLEGTTYRPGHPLDDTAGVEHSDDLVARVTKGLDYLRSLDADIILVVSHGAVGRAVRAVLEPYTTFLTSPKFGNA
jgi:probable phosphoglycerate mutase